MPAEVFFAHPREAGTLTLAQLGSELSLAGFVAKIIPDEDEQIWIEFEGFRSRLLTSKEEPLCLITLQFYGDAKHEAPLIERIESLLRQHGYIDAEQFPQ